MDKEEIKEQTDQLRLCPFCDYPAEFYISKNDNAPLRIRHIPPSGVNCPARGFDQFCEGFKQGRLWWQGEYQ